MSYILKLKKRDNTEVVYPGVDLIQITPLLTESGQGTIGTEIEMQMVGENGQRISKRVRLPQDGTDIYMTSNDSPATLDSWHWPPHPRKIGRKGNVRQVFRVTEASERSKQNG